MTAYGKLDDAAEPVVLNRSNGRITQALLPLQNGGASLYWQFDGFDDGAPLFLLIDLTEREAQAVFDTDWSMGLLEPIRRHIGDRAGLVCVGSRPLRVSNVRIPRYRSEPALVKVLLRAANKARELPAHSAAGSTVRRAVSLTRMALA